VLPGGIVNDGYYGRSGKLGKSTYARAAYIGRIWLPSLLLSLSNGDNFRKFRMNEHPLKCGFTGTPVERLEEIISRPNSATTLD
jgi:hypothetical protein